ELNPAAFSVDGCFSPGRCVALAIEENPKPIQVGTDGGSYRRRVFPNAAGEDHGVRPAQEEQVRAEVMPHRSDKDGDGLLSALIPLTCPGPQVGEIMALPAAQSEESRAVSQIVHHLF